MNTTFAARIPRIALVLAALVCGTLARAQETSPEPSPAVAQSAPVPAPVPLASSLAPKLEALSPVDPAAYFLLGEEASARAQSPDDFRLARQLLVLAFELDRQVSGGRSIGASSLLALADISALDHERRWLRATARRLDPRYIREPWRIAGDRAVDSVTAYSAATALGMVRKGDGIGARQLFAIPGVFDAIRRYDAILAPSGTAGASEIARDADRWPCPECRNERVVRKQGSNPPEYRLCSTCRGDPGPKLTPAQLLAQIRVESMLLGKGEASTPSIASEFSTPLIDPDPAGVAKWYRVDPSLCIWRNGGWAPLNAQDAPPEPASAESTPAEATPADAPAPK
jgi:hypothetical protein